MSQVDHVDATFGGERVRFRLAPEHLPGFEAAIQGPAYQCFTRFAGGWWTFRDVEAVLTAALPLDVDAAAARRVQAALRSRPPAVYAVLATKILEAALFGIDPAVAVFDEEVAELTA